MSLVKTNNRLSGDQWMNQFFHEFTNVFQDNRSGRTQLHTPAVNISELNNGYDMELLAPGFNKTDFKVRLEANTLTISAEQSKTIAPEATHSATDGATAETDTKESKTKEQVLRKEFSIKSFSRSFQLNEKIDMSNISAKYENGVLFLHLPIKEAEKVTVKSIEIQ